MNRLLLSFFLPLISLNQFCRESEYRMKLYGSNLFVVTVPMNENFSPNKRWQSLLLLPGQDAKIPFNAKDRCFYKSNGFCITLFRICHVICWSVFHFSFASSLEKLNRRIKTWNRKNIAEIIWKEGCLVLFVKKSRNCISWYKDKEWKL